MNDHVYKEEKHQITGIWQSFHYIFSFIFGKEKGRISFLIFLIILTGLIPAIDSIFLQRITDSIETYSDIMGKNIVQDLFIWCIIYAAWWESQNIVWRAYDYVYLKALPRVREDVIDRLYNYVQHHSSSFFLHHLAGDITNRITNAANSIDLIFEFLNENILRRFVMLIFAIITLYFVHAIFAAIFLLWVMLFCAISIFAAKNVNRYSNIFGHDKAVVAGKIVDSIANISAIRFFSNYKKERQYLKNYTAKLVTSDENMQWFMFKLRYVLGVSCSIMIFVMIYAILVMKGRGEISVGDCVLIITLCFAIIDDIWDLIQEFGDLFEQVGTFAQSLSLLREYDLIDAENAAELVVNTPTIEFDAVSFKYSKNNNVFTNQSLFIPAEQKVGLVGLSGSGKTTFTNLITRLYDITDGKITIDQQDIRHVTQKTLRDNISIIPQEPILFHRSILDNIRYGNEDASEEEVREAAKLAHVDDFVKNMPLGYHSLCGERGNSLSGGQRQRIIIARAILKNAPILILDEATSSLDNATERKIQESLRYLMKGKTVLIIAHRLNTLMDMDRILVFGKGHVIEDGSHEELIKEGTFYQQLWSLQTLKV